jgi:hypothetical protein
MEQTMREVCADFGAELREFKAEPSIRRIGRRRPISVLRQYIEQQDRPARPAW